MSDLSVSIARCGGRKFLITVFVLLAALAAVVTKTKIDPDIVTLVKWIVGLYFAGNVSQKVAAAKPAKPDTPPAV